VNHTETETVTQAPTDIRSASLTILAAIAVVLLLQYAQQMLIPVVLGVLINYALDPVVTLLERARLPRALGAALVLTVTVAGGAALVYGLSGQATTIIDQLPDAARRIRQQLESRKPQADNTIDKVQKAANELEKVASAATAKPSTPGVSRVQVEQPAFDLGSYVVSGSLGIMVAFGQLILILFLAFFLLASGDLYRKKLVKIAGPSLTKKKITLQILSEIDRQIAAFLLVQVFTSALVGVASWLAFRAIGLQQAALWGLLAGIFNSIPYVGPIVVTGGTMLVALLQFGEIRMALIVGAVTLAITSLEGFLLTPWLTSRAAQMNAVAVFINILFWGWIWGVWGALLAVPMLMVIKAVCDHVEEFKPVSELIGD
jgi:predicted PurR-regulated permease PerM